MKGLSWASASPKPAAVVSELRGKRHGMITRAARLPSTLENHAPAPQIAAAVISALQVWLTDWVATGRKMPIDTVADDIVQHLKSPWRRTATVVSEHAVRVHGTRK